MPFRCQVDVLEMIRSFTPSTRKLAGQEMRKVFLRILVGYYRAAEHRKAGERAAEFPEAHFRQDCRFWARLDDSRSCVEVARVWVELPERGACLAIVPIGDVFCDSTDCVGQIRFGSQLQQDLGDLKLQRVE